MNRLERPIMGYHGGKWRTEVILISPSAQKNTASQLPLEISVTTVHNKEKQHAPTTA